MTSSLLPSIMVINDSHTKAENWKFGFWNTKSIPTIFTSPPLRYRWRGEQMGKSDNWSDKENNEGYAFITFDSSLANNCDSGKAFIFYKICVCEVLSLPCTACGELGLASSLYLCVPPGAPYCQSGCAWADNKSDKHPSARERERVTGTWRSLGPSWNQWPEVLGPVHSLTK